MGIALEVRTELVHIAVRNSSSSAMITDSNELAKNIFYPQDGLISPHSAELTNAQ